MNALGTPRQRLRSFVLGAALAALGCTDDPVDVYAPLSVACDACLSREAGGCTEPWNACLELEACEVHVTCQLDAGCYAEPADSTCADDAGCELDDAPGSEAAAVSAEFEGCARTTCRDACEFSEP